MNKIFKFIRRLLSFFIFDKKLRHLFVDGLYKQCEIYINYKLHNNKKFDYNLSVVLIIKNAAQYMDEWICYHKIVGVDHFYIYDNESEDNLKEVLKPYIKKGVVTYTYWPGKKQQVTVYDHALNKYRNETKWMAFIDDDEFMVPVAGNTIPEVLSSLELQNGITMPWIMYGTSGHKKETKDFVISRFRKHGTDITNYKSIINPRLCEKLDVHAGIFINGFCYEENKLMKKMPIKALKAIKIL